MNERWLWQKGFHLEDWSQEGTPLHYDPGLERLDVAVRAVCRDLQKRQGKLLVEAGIDLEHLPTDIYPRSEEQVFQVPYPILAAAMELLRLYVQKVADDRFLHYQVLKGEPYVVHLPA